MNRMMIAALALCLATPAFAGTMNKDQSTAPNSPTMNHSNSSMSRDYKATGLTLDDAQQKAIWSSVADAKSQKAPENKLKVGQKMPQWITLKPLPQQAKNELGVAADGYQYAKVGNRVILAERDGRRVADIITE